MSQRQLCKERRNLRGGKKRTKMQNHCGQSEVAKEGLDLELERSSDSLILLLAIQKAGGASAEPKKEFGRAERKGWGLGQ